jgi:hypothetical protein
LLTYPVLRQREGILSGWEFCVKNGKLTDPDDVFHHLEYGGIVSILEQSVPISCSPVWLM